MSIANELLTLNNTKQAIKEAIINKGVDVGEEDTFASYADKIGEIEGGGGGSTPLDTSKISYARNNNTNYSIRDGRILEFLRNSDGFTPLIDNYSPLDINWAESFEIGVSFKFSSQGLSEHIFLFGSNANNNFNYAPALAWLGNNSKFEIICSYTSSAWAFDDATDVYPCVADTWYLAKVKFDSSTMEISIQISEDFKTFTTIYTRVLTQSLFHNSSYGIYFGSLVRQPSNYASNNISIDTFNTYVKDATGSIVWGCFEGQGAEYELYDYIQSDGTQVIDLGFAPKNGDVITVTNIPLSAQSQASFMWGATDSSAWIGVVQNAGNTKTIYSNNTSGSIQNITRDALNVDTITANRDYTNNLCMFGFFLDGEYSHTITTRLFSVKVNDNFYLPTKRRSDGVFGLYDVANQTFLTDSAGGNPLTGGQAICVFDEATTPSEEIIFNAENIQICTSQGYYLPQQPFDVNITEAGQYIVSLHRISDDQVWSSIITYDGVSDTTFSISYERGFTLHITPTSIGCQYYEGSWFDIYIKLSKALDSQIYIT